MVKKCNIEKLKLKLSSMGLDLTGNKKELMARLKRAKEETTVLLDVSRMMGAGRGVFTTRMIAEGEFCCVYDGKDVKFEDVTPEDLSHPYAQLNPFAGVVRLGYREPVSSIGIGQLVNDAARLNFHCDPQTSTVYVTRSEIEAYETSSNAGNNVHFIPPGFNLHASRQIDQGKELLMHYGVTYWLARMREVCGQSRIDVIAGSAPNNWRLVNWDTPCQ